MSFLLYLVGFLILIGGVAWAMVLAGVQVVYITIVSVILLGIGVLTGVTRTRPRDKA